MLYKILIAELLLFYVPINFLYFNINYFQIICFTFFDIFSFMSEIKQYLRNKKDTLKLWYS